MADGLQDVAERAFEDPRQLLIGGEWMPAAGGAVVEVEDPAAAEVVGEVADAGPLDGERALASAWRAQRTWASTPPWDRAEILRATHEAMVADAGRLAALLTLETGKPLAEAEAEVSYSADFMRWYADLAPQASGRYRAAPQGGMRLLTIPQAVGPCLLICPWNLPLAMAARKVAPAIAAGCTFVLKPAGQTPLTTLAFAELLERCGLPPGVSNVLTTSDAGALTAPLIADPRLRKLSFTGSTEVGTGLLRMAADGVKRTSMELGGNAPLIVFADCDFDHAIEQTAIATLRNAGQSCIAANRIYVERRILADFATALAERLAEIGAGPPVGIGPLIDARAREGVERIVDSAVGAGASILTGGERLDGPGYYYAPTLLSEVPSDSPAVTTEIFGPAAAINPFDGEEEVVAAANSIGGGLVSYVFSRDLDRVLRLGDRLDTGMVGINRGVVSNAAAPFGGVKESGLGREGGEEGLREYQELKYLAIDGEPGVPELATALTMG